MTLKNILILIIFSLLSVYIAFLNPHEVEVYLTQSYSLHLPMVILLLGFILVGVLLTLFINWFFKVKTSLGNVKANFKKNQIVKKDRWCASLVERGENALAGGNLEKAKSLFNNVLAEFPNHVGALDQTGKIARLEGKADQALELHLKANKIDPENLRVLCNLADDYCNTGAPGQEIKILEKIRKSEPASPMILSRIRDSYLNRKDWKNASEVQKRLISLTRDKNQQNKEQKLYGQILFQNGLIYWENGQVDSAISEFKKTLRVSDKCLPAYLTLGDAYLKSGNKKSAIKTWRTGLEMTHSPLCLIRIQNVMMESDDLNGLIKIYKESIQSSSNSAKDALTLMLGILYMDKGEMNEAIETLETMQAEKSVLHSVLLSNAYQQKQDSLQMGKASQMAFNIAKESLLDVVCKKCNTHFKEWSSHCPECKTWDSLSTRLQLQNAGK